MKHYKSILLFTLLACLLFACKQEPKATAVKKPPVKIPAFNQDSAYVFVEKQLNFGARNPGSEGHINCKNWFVQKFESYGATVIAQEFNANIYTGDSHKAWNIIAQFNPEIKDRVIISAHWDSRFIGEEDDNKQLKDKPIPGADDGGSGCGIIIELARILKENPIDLGVDLVLWDAEDQGNRGRGNNYSWCLGSQHWSKNKHKKNYKANFGINLDMVGSKNPSFGKDRISLTYAGSVINKVWKLAQSMGYSDMFLDKQTGELMDDHRIINEIAGIPMINIINQPDIIDKNS